MKVVLLHPGTQYSHRLVCELNRLGFLYKFITGIGFTSNDPLLRLFPTFIRRKIGNRILSCSIPASHLVNIRAPELSALFKLYRGGKPEDILFKRNQSFQRLVRDRHLKNAEYVVGFDTSSWIIADRAKEMGRPFLLDQSIAHPREKVEIFDRLRLEYPQWSADIPKKDERLVMLEEKEYATSTKIVVASGFTQRSLVKHGVEVSKIVVNPYGVGNEFFKPKLPKRRGEKVRFIYLGLLGARKGLPLLLDSWTEGELFKTAELWIAGPADEHAKNAVAAIPGVFYKGKVSHNEIPRLLSHCDCLVFPSFFEGFGQVILEAMASSLTVIATDATAAPDIIEDFREGFIIKAGDRNELKDRMEILSKDPVLCYNMGNQAREKAKTFSWNAYGDRWKSIIRSI